MRPNHDQHSTSVVRVESTMKTIHHDNLWVKQACRQHGRICDKYVSRVDHDIELHIKTREPKPSKTTDGPPCIGCKGRKKGTK